MNLIDKAILEWSYRTKKGYPDLNNEEDIRVFESLFGFNLINESVKSQGAKAVEDIVSDFGSKYGFYQLKSKKYRLGSPEESSPEFFTDFFKSYFNTDSVDVLKPRQAPNDSGKFLGYLIDTEKYGKILIIVSSSKPGGTGVSNEQELVDNINKVYADNSEEALTVNFNGKNSLSFKNIIGATRIGDEGGQSWRTAKAARDAGEEYALVKGDVLLHTKSGEDISLSVKEKGDFRWESAKTRYPEIFKNFMEKGIKGEIPNLEFRQSEEVKNLLLMVNPNNDKPYGKVFVTGLPRKDFEGMAFGKDNAKVIQQTFEPSHFTFSNGTLDISVANAIDSIDDFDEDELPIIEFERNASKVAKSDIDPMNVEVQRGIGIRTVPRSKMKHGEKANVLILDLKDIL